VTSLRSAVQQGGKVPGGQTVKVAEFAAGIGLTPPFSLRDVILSFDPVGKFLSSGTLAPGNVTGWCQLGVTSDGFASFRGHVHEAGLIGDNYIFTAQLNWQDPTGKYPVFVHTGSVAGQAEFGSSDDSFQDDGTFYSPLRSHQWDAIQNAGSNFNLHVQTDPWQVVEAVVAGLIGLAVGAFVIWFTGGASCDWGATVSGETGPDGVGVDVGPKCERR